MSLAVQQVTGQAPITSGTVVFTLSTVPQAGNVLIAFCAYSQFSLARTITTPAGWTKFDDNTVINDSIACFWYVVKYGDSGSYTFTISDATDNTAGALYELTGANTANPIHKFINTKPAAGTINTSTTGSLTPSTWGTLALAALGADSNLGTFSSISAGWTEQANEQGGFHPLWSASRNALTADITTAINTTFTMASSPGTDQGIMELVLINAGPSRKSSSNYLRPHPFAPGIAR